MASLPERVRRCLTAWSIRRRSVLRLAHPSDFAADWLSARVRRVYFVPSASAGIALLQWRSASVARLPRVKAGHVLQGRILRQPRPYSPGPDLSSGGRSRVLFTPCGQWRLPASRIRRTVSATAKRVSTGPRSLVELAVALHGQRSHGLVEAAERVHGGVVDQGVAFVGVSRPDVTAVPPARPAPRGSGGRRPRTSWPAWARGPCGRKLTKVSTMSSGAGSVGVSARPDLPMTDSTSGKLPQQRVAGLEVVGRLGHAGARHGDRHVHRPCPRRAAA